MTEVDYAKVLADLIRRREQLDAAIRAISEIVGQDAPAGPGLPKPERPRSVTAPGAFAGMSLEEAAKAHLRSVSGSRTTAQIEQALRAGGVKSTAKSFYNSVYSVLRRESLSPESEIEKAGRSRWKLASRPTEGAASEDGPPSGSTREHRPGEQAIERREPGK